MKKLAVLIFVLYSSSSLSAQSVESNLEFILDSIYQAHPASVGIMAHVEAPEKGISWSGASGHSDKSHDSKLDPAQPALIASSIKTYVSASILRLVEKGELSLETPIAHHLTDKTKKIFEKDGYELKVIRIKHLLSHTSGIEDYVNMDYIEFIDKNPKHRWTRNEQLERAVKVGDPLGNPGEQFNYADANYLLLTEIIENITGQPFYQSMRQLLKYEELGIKNTWFPTLEDELKADKPLVHQYWGEKNWDSHSIDISVDLYGGGGIACPTKELALFIQHYFNGDIVENDSIRNLIFTVIPTKETENNPYYLGLAEYSYNGMKAYGHGGFWGTVMMYFPAINTSISVYILEKNERGLQKDVLTAMTKVMFNEYSERLNAYSTPNEESELESITRTLMDYIDGTANGEPEKLRKAFHPDFNLYSITDSDSLRIWVGQDYISRIKVGKKNSREGRIISIDYENNAAIAKAEIVIPGWRIFTDYFMLLKYEGDWKIVHKSYTWREYPNKEENK